MAIKKIIKQIITSLTPKAIREFYAYPFMIPLIQEIKTLKKQYEYVNMSYSQEGEDLFLNRIFADKREGFYVDIGAHHPKRFSNTYSFYRRGWRGINIDAMPGSMRLFNEQRPEDINLEVGISVDNNKVLKYFIFNEPGLNTFSEEVAKKNDGIYNRYYITDILELKVERLDSILDAYLPKNQHIDFFSIDVEGLDLQVLQSNNWEQYRPDIILVESDDSPDIQAHINSEIAAFLNSVNYQFIGKTFKTLFFQNAKA